MAVVKKEPLKNRNEEVSGEKEISLSRSSCRDSGLLEQSAAVGQIFRCATNLPQSAAL
jgi:hypothetical protein